MGKWIIRDNILSFEQDKKIVTPSATVFSQILSSGADQFPEYPNIKFHHPAIDLPGFRCSSKYPKLNVMVSFEKDGKIQLEFFIKISGQKIELTRSLLKKTDCLIFNNTVYSLTEAKTLMEGILEDASIKDTGAIKIGEYLELRKIISGYTRLINWSDEALLENFTKNIDHNDVQVPIEFTGHFYPYQEDGYLWMKHFTNENFGCILGDEMGLGKTIQIIALLVSRRKNADSPALVVCPVSLLKNWEREIEKFSDGMKVYTYHGFSILGDVEPLKDFDIVLTTYGTVVNYLTSLNTFTWDIVILDEAQYIKNPRSKRTLAAKRLHKKCGIVVSGTPFENKLTDIWSLTDFVYPKYLGDVKDFERLNWDESDEKAEAIEPLIRPLLLRRRLSEVASDLPERVDIPVYLEMDPYGAMLYEELRQALRERYGEYCAIAEITGLRNFCTHPFVQSKQKDGNLRKCSRKYQAFSNIVENIISNGEKFIVFTSFTHMNTLIVNDITKTWKIPVFSLTGTTPAGERQGIVDTFSNIKGAAGLVLNPKAGGVGLNITAANHVIHYNPEWNPAVEDQASARAHRRGQKKTVFVYRLIYCETIEEVMDERLMRKRTISEHLIVGNKGDSDRSDLIRALSLSPFHGER